MQLNEIGNSSESFAASPEIRTLPRLEPVAVHYEPVSASIPHAHTEMGNCQAETDAEKSATTGQESPDSAPETMTAAAKPRELRRFSDAEQIPRRDQTGWLTKQSDSNKSQLDVA